ncbi:FtsJ methyltransferase domain-containing protein 2 [Linnemannia gamsii]|uniref:Cap-specific mRNA (nucleoside-2'-O-)-methyltransferase 1 n=1 Tax=Linnemannia gamsii TaxID=64522 RepID=A0ABQ7JWU0_9FUNG|nr:FtsJ methyltransferase domain-containing protein 2 [Linnemannia gamsii]
MDPYNDSDPAYAATPLESTTAIPTFHNCPKVRFQQTGGNRGGPNHGPGPSGHNHQRPPFQFDAHHSQGPLRYDPNHGLQPQAYPPHGQGHHANNTYHQQNQQLMRPLIPPAEFLDQHLDVFQASSYDIPPNCFQIKYGRSEAVDLDLFCFKGIVDNLVESKKRLRAVPQDVFGRARQRCNPYELVGSSIFMNRASVKLASIDSQLALTATKEDPSIGNESEGNGNSKMFRFVDLCSGPGGFSEYLLWRKHTWGERARGWAMTLKGDLDFQVEKFHKDAAVQDNLRIYYGRDGTGDILNQENIDAFAALVDQQTNGLGVGLVSADGGISVDGDEAVQETLLQRLILCQILAMFMTLQKGGDFVVKIFDIFTPVTAGLVWILSRNFEKICVMKPLTSRPMNSERYVVCRHLLKRQPSQVIEHLKEVNSRYQQLKNKEVSTASATGETEAPLPSASSLDSTREDINHIVDLAVLTSDSHFMEYIKRNNMKTAIRQTEALDVFLKYVNEGLRPAFDQEAIKKLCLQEWHIPPRPQPYHPQQQQQQQQQQHQPRYQQGLHHQHHQHSHHHQQQQPPQQQYGHPQQRYPAPHPPQQHQQQQQHRSHPYAQQSAPGGPRRPPPPGQRGQSSGLLDSLLNNMQPNVRRH